MSFASAILADEYVNTGRNFQLKIFKHRKIF